MSSTVNYYMDGENLKTFYGVCVSSSQGLISKPKLKRPVSVNWDTENGEVVDLSKRYYEAREITLDCFIIAENEAEFIVKSNAFISDLTKPNTRRLAVTVDTSEPLVYEVYINEDIDVKKTWRNSTMVGTFTLKLREPEPIKKVLKYTRTSNANKTVSLTITSTKSLNIYWGDKAHSFDLVGTAQTFTHDYSQNGTFYIVITGDIDAITSLTTNASIVWETL